MCEERMGWGLQANMQRLNDAFDSGGGVFLFLAGRETSASDRSRAPPPPVPRLCGLSLCETFAFEI